MLKPLAVVLILPLAGTVACAAPDNTFIAPAMSACDGSAPPEKMRIVTWNIRSTKSSSLDTIGDVLQGLDADVIALQEVDRDAPRTGTVDQAAELADRLGMTHAYAAARKEGSGDFGVALLSRLPFASANPIELPGDNALERRVALDTSLCFGDHTVRAVTVHADVFPWAGEENARYLANQIEESAGEGVVVAGDLNASPLDLAVDAFLDLGLKDVIKDFNEAPTFSDRRIDYVLMDEPLGNTAVDGHVEDTDASDHRPLAIDLHSG
ncbi:MAG: endonuclease/exonuclease/phosphatase family protein [Deltaproteobacteria bacterium]|nr:endonuclease/exonuclease/phosphatase family protein [Deltaproteobacteria bacterium]